MSIQKTFLLFEAYDSICHSLKWVGVADSTAAPSIANIALNSIALVSKNIAYSARDADSIPENPTSNG